MNLGFNKVTDSTLYKLRFSTQQEMQIKFLGPNAYPYEEFYSVGMLFGRGFTGKYGQIYFSGGFGITGGVKRGRSLYSTPKFIGGSTTYEEVKFISPSIPIEIEVLPIPRKYNGVGFALYGDLNLERPMFGFVVKIRLVKLR